MQHNCKWTVNRIIYQALLEREREREKVIEIGNGLTLSVLTSPSLHHRLVGPVWGLGCQELIGRGCFLSEDVGLSKFSETKYTNWSNIAHISVKNL